MAAPKTIPASARLSYRLMDSSDAQLWFELDQDPEVMRYLNDSKPTTWQQINEFFIPRVAGFTNPATGCGLWEVSNLGDGEYLGMRYIDQRVHHTPLRNFDCAYYEMPAQQLLTDAEKS